jgi:ATP-dependent RNA helicase DDX56/DBP9
VTAKAPCGSGKTAAYLLPVLSKILRRNQVIRRSLKSRTSAIPCQADTAASTVALIVVPTRELVNQVYKTVQLFSAFCARDILVRTVALAQRVSDTAHRAILSTSPNVVIATPSSAWNSANASVLILDNVAHVVID